MASREHSLELVAGEEVMKERVDSYISKTAGLSRSLISQDSSEIKINGKVSKKSAKVSGGDRICLTWSEEFFEGLQAQDIDLNILYEDDSILVINKEQGMVVHPGAGNYEGTVCNALVHRYGNRFFSEGEDDDEGEVSSRPGIVHRLDKDTSGTMVIALNRDVHNILAEQFAAHETGKTYICIAKGWFEKKRGKISTNIVRDPKDRKKFMATDDRNRGKTALTSYLVLRQFEGYALVRVSLHTGRTHQIRVHMASINHPLLGDPIYSRKDNEFPDATLMLHALKLTIDHPVTGERMTFTSPLPKRFYPVIMQLKNKIRTYRKS